jgi:DNA polymerase III subunit epsilon
MGRCLSPCLGDLDPNLYRRRLDDALAVFTGSDDGRDALIAHLEREMRAASDARRYERAATLRRRRDRLSVLLDRLGGVLRATHARPRLVAASAPDAAGADAFWLVGGRLIDWGELSDQPPELERRTGAALARGGRPGATAHVPPAEIDEVRIVSTWLAHHEDDVATLTLDPPPDGAHLAEFAAGAQNA